MNSILSKILLTPDKKILRLNEPLSARTARLISEYPDVLRTRYFVPTTKYINTKSINLLVQVLPDKFQSTGMPDENI